jgi:hypothetical protein
VIDADHATREGRVACRVRERLERSLGSFHKPCERDQSLLLRKSHECRASADKAATSWERDRWLAMADAFLEHAEKLGECE